MTDNPNKLNEDAELPPGAAGGGRGRYRTMLVRYGKMGMVGQFRHHEREIASTVTHVVVHTERGLEIGEIISPFCHSRGTCSIAEDKIDAYCQKSGPNYPITRQGRFVRFATEQDVNEQRHLDRNAQEKMGFCEQLIEKYHLPMQLVAVEHLFGGDRIIYYFMADSRVDFRELVKELAQQYHTRIEMRQIGARDEARLIADYETCGRQCCCKNFLKVLQPVNMRMAKIQKATLDPSKISGRCGRLKCCLRYEDEVYTALSQNLPRDNSYVLTEQGAGQVLETQVITQLVKVRLESGRIIAINVDEILQRDLAEPPEKTAQLGQEPPEELSTAGLSEEAAVPAEENIEKPKKKRRRRRRKQKMKEDVSGESEVSGEKP